MSNVLQNNIYLSGGVQAVYPESPLMLNWSLDAPELSPVMDHVGADVMAWVSYVMDESGVDTATRNHERRVACATGFAALELGLTTSQIEKMFVGGILHDSGKYGEIKDIINSSAKLTPETRRIVDMHSFLGAIMILEHPFEKMEQVNPFEWQRRRAITLHAATEAFSHHMFNVKHAYPETDQVEEFVHRGLINHIEAKKMRAYIKSYIAGVVSAVDMIDAMTESRPYRTPENRITLEKATAITEAECGSKIGRRVLDAVKKAYTTELPIHSAALEVAQNVLYLPTFYAQTA